MDSYDEEEFKRRLSDEYKILQDKIDKIGAFRFTIKGWSITAALAASAAASGKGLSTVFAVSLGLVLMLVFFFLLEYEQVKHSNLFGDRAGRIEDAFKKISLSKGQEVYAVFPAPHTAHELIWAGHREKSRGRNQQSRGAKETGGSLADKWQVSKKAHLRFYVVLILLALVPLLPHYREIGNQGRELKESVIHILARQH